MKRSPIPSLLTALLFSVSLTGCLGFKEQTLAFHLDAAHDTLRIFQVYHGIFAEPHEKPGLSDEEREQLESVLTSERTFFFTNFAYEINKAQIANALADLHDPRKQKSEPRSGGYTPEELKRAGHLGKLAMENVHIKNGAFYLDAKRRLCGTQQVTITKWSEVLAAGNAALRDLLRHETQQDRKLDAEEKAALLSRIEQTANFLQVQGHGIVITLPVSRERYDAVTEDRPAGEDVPPTESPIAAFRRQGGKLSYADHVMTITFIPETPAPPTITLPTGNEEYRDNVIAPLQEKKQDIKDTYDVAKFRDEFLFAK